MVCPNCGSTTTEVTNSRRLARKQQIWRRRLCKQCSFTFTTRELPDLSYLSVTKKSGQNEPFYPAKLLVSLLRACDHLENAQEAASALAETITGKLIPAPNGRLTTAEIALAAMDVLKRFNAAAQLKYASYQTDLTGSRQVRAQLKRA